MFGMKVNEQITLKILEAHDTEALFNLVNRSRDSLREWLPWVATIRYACIYQKRTFAIC